MRLNGLLYEVAGFFTTGSTYLFQRKKAQSEFPHYRWCRNVVISGVLFVKAFIAGRELSYSDLGSAAFCSLLGYDFSRELSKFLPALDHTFRNSYVCGSHEFL